MVEDDPVRGITTTPVREDVDLVLSREPAREVVTDIDAALGRCMTNEAREAGKQFGALARNIVRTGKPLQRPCCVVAGGETTVTVTGNGKGGRAQEFAAAAALEIAGLADVWVMAIGTDGTDGPTDAAGAVVDGDTAARAQRRSIDLESALKCHNTYPALKKLHQLITTGPTGTNVNDLYLLLML